MPEYVLPILSVLMSTMCFFIGVGITKVDMRDAMIKRSTDAANARRDANLLAHNVSLYMMHKGHRTKLAVHVMEYYPLVAAETGLSKSDMGRQATRQASDAAWLLKKSAQWLEPGRFERGTITDSQNNSSLFVIPDEEMLDYFRRAKAIASTLMSWGK